MRLSRLKFVVFALAAMAVSCGVAAGGLLAADLYLHHRTEESAGLNYRGYRGPVAGRKRPGELRVIVLGASTAFGYGVRWQEAFPAVLERLLHSEGPSPSAKVINLGYNGEGSYAMLPTLQDYEYLDADVVCLYPDTDHMGDGGFNTALYRHRSAAFRLTGYYPILPLALEEKAAALRSGGHLDQAYRSHEGESRNVGSAAGASASALEVASKTIASMGSVLERLTGPPVPPTLPESLAGCSTPWKHFCDAVYAAVRHARSRGQAVVVMQSPQMVGPYVRPGQITQGAALDGMLARHFGADPAVTMLPLAPVIDVADKGQSYDGTHPTPVGHARIAQALVEPVRRVARGRAQARP